MCHRHIASLEVGVVILGAGESALKSEAQRVPAASPDHQIPASTCTEENRDHSFTPSSFSVNAVSFGVSSNIALRILLITFCRKRTHLREMEKKHQGDTLLALITQ